MGTEAGTGRIDQNPRQPPSFKKQSRYIRRWPARFCALDFEFFWGWRENVYRAGLPAGRNSIDLIVARSNLSLPPEGFARYSTRKPQTSDRRCAIPFLRTNKASSAFAS